MSPKPTVPPSQIKTRAKNKSSHPGIPDRAPPRRTSVEVENERAAKARATAAQQEKKRQNIRRAAEFEHADMGNEPIADATPRPIHTPKPWPPPRNRGNASLGPVAEASDNPNDDFSSELSFKPLYSEESATEKETAAESDSPRPAKKLKAQMTGKAKPKMGRTPPRKKGRKAALRDEEIVRASNEAIEPTSDEKTPRKPRKAKAKVRDEIDMEAKKIEEDKILKNGGDMARPTSSQQVGEERSGTASPQPPVASQVQASGLGWMKSLKRTGAIADLGPYTRQSDQQSTKRAQLDDNNPIRQVLRNILSLIPHVRVIANT